MKEGNEEKDLKIFYKLYSEALKQDGVSALSYNYFKDFLKIFKNNALILTAFSKEIPLSTV